MRLEQKLKQKKSTHAVIGLGYVGLPLAVEFAKAGLTSIGIDIVRDTVSRVNAGSSYIGDVSSKDLVDVVESGKLSATVENAPLISDTKNFLKDFDSENIVRL